MNNVDVQLNTIPSEPADAWAQFNKITGEFTGVFQKVPLAMLNHEYYDYKEININVENESVVGNRDSFRVVKNSDAPRLMYESTLDNLMYAKIDSKYSLYQRLDIIAGAIEKLLEASDLVDPAVSEMADYIVEVKRVNEITKESYAKDPVYTYLSKTAEQEKSDAQMEGGLHEFFGPRTPTPSILDSGIV